MSRSSDVYFRRPASIRLCIVASWQRMMLEHLILFSFSISNRYVMLLPQLVDFDSEVIRLTRIDFF